MAYLREEDNGEWYVYRTPGGKPNKGRAMNVYRNWWLIKYIGSKTFCGYLGIKGIYLPQEFIGKKIRLKIEVIEE